MDKFADLRAALDAGPTDGPWRASTDENAEHVAMLCTSGIARFEIVSESDAPLADIAADAYFIAAANPETIRALLAERDALREALQKVRPVIAADRQALLDCHGDGNEIPAADKLGTLGLYEYDGALNAIDAALAQHQVGGAQ